jgi:hypothetical protein
MEAHDRNTDDTQYHVENDNRSSNVIFVTCPTRCVHHDSCQSVWRSNQTLRRADRETHILSENNGQEVCERICDGGGVEEYLYSSVVVPGCATQVPTIAKPQILISAPPRRNFFRSQGSGFASPRSLLTLSMMNFASRSLRKCHDVWALSGKSTSAQ